MTNLEWLRDQCCQYLNYRCETRACLVRGGYVSGPPDYDMATCHAKEVIDEIKRLREALEEIAAAGPAEEPAAGVRHCNSLAAEGYGTELGLWQAAEIARAALKEETTP